MTLEEIKKVMPSVKYWLSPILTTQGDVVLCEKGLRTFQNSKVVPYIDLEKFTGYFLFDNREQDCCITASFRFQIYHISEGVLGVNMDMLDISRVEKGTRFCCCFGGAYKFQSDVKKEEIDFPRFLDHVKGTQWLIAP